MIETLLAGVVYYLVTLRPPYYDAARFEKLFATAEECESVRRVYVRGNPYTVYFCTAAESSILVGLGRTEQSEEIQRLQLEAQIQLIELLKEVRALLKKSDKGP